MEGYILVDKPVGWTSFDVVSRIRHVVAKVENKPARKIKVGHSGTLDPFASGLLIILIGSKYTKQSQTLLKQYKTYAAVMELGKYSSTGDVEGEIKSIAASITPPKEHDIKIAFKVFIGKSMQVPPIYSAIKVNGTRAYKLARNNLPVELAAREIDVTRLDLIDYNYPLVKFETEVSSGTYIRTLVEDIAKQLENRALTVELRRSKIGKYSITDASSINDINEQTIGSLLKYF